MSPSSGTSQTLVSFPVLRLAEARSGRGPCEVLFDCDILEMMNRPDFKIAALAGDGIGPEVMREAVGVLRAVEAKFHLRLQITEAAVGWAGIDASGQALPDATLELCRRSDAILFGSVGLPDRDPSIPKEQRPERAALLRIRKEFGLYANLRPVRLPKSLAHACPLRPERQGDGIDILVVRELTGGMYFGQPKKTEEIPAAPGAPATGWKRAIDTMVYTTPEIERIACVAFASARSRRKKVSSIDKANVLENGVLWREVVTRVGKDYSDVALEHIFVDNAAMQLVLKPSQFDVILCENMFGDILSDEAAALGGSLGMLPSASLGASTGGTTFGFYEPAGGTAPDIAGKDLANPIAQILSAALMLRHSFGRDDAARAIEGATLKVIDQGLRTGDIFTPAEASARKVGTREMGAAIAAAL
jgi:3-isopropylmalate dehydrogenase